MTLRRRLIRIAHSLPRSSQERRRLLMALATGGVGSYLSRATQTYLDTELHPAFQSLTGLQPKGGGLFAGNWVLGKGRLERTVPVQVSIGVRTVYITERVTEITFNGRILRTDLNRGSKWTLSLNGGTNAKALARLIQAEVHAGIPRA